MRHGSLFSGIGGFDLAAQWMGWTNVFHTEWNEFGQKVLKHHFPNSISYHDIIKTDYSIHRNDIDIITGGFPCQPFSSAGRQLGEDDPRNMWPATIAERDQLAIKDERFKKCVSLEEIKETIEEARSRIEFDSEADSDVDGDKLHAQFDQFILSCF